MCSGLLFKRGRACGLRLLLRNSPGNLLPSAPQETLEVIVEVDLRLGEQGVDLVLVRLKEGAELGLVEPCRPGCLRKGQVEQEESLDGVVEW